MKIKFAIYVLFATVFLLGACGPQQTATPDQAAIQHQIETGVALTVASNDAATAAAIAAQPTATATVIVATTPTNVTFPTLTPFATITPFVITPGSTGGGGSGSGSGGTPSDAAISGDVLLTEGGPIHQQ